MYSLESGQLLQSFNHSGAIMSADADWDGGLVRRLGKRGVAPSSSLSYSLQFVWVPVPPPPRNKRISHLPPPTHTLQQVASGSRESVCVWDIVTGRRVAELGAPGEVKALCFRRNRYVPRSDSACPSAASTL